MIRRFSSKALSHKTPALRTAITQCSVYLPDGIDVAIRENNVKKGDVLSCARIAGIMAAKKTHTIIPLCHPIALSSVNIDFELKNKKLIITSKAETYGTTGVEVDSMIATSAAALTVYDMVKALSKKVVINNIRLLSKTGGKSGDFKA
jgi:cyclic pyranopterin phosphate synthase